MCMVLTGVVSQIQSQRVNEARSAMHAARAENAELESSDDVVHLSVCSRDGWDGFGWIFRWYE